jgi:hypothetical protein
MYMAALAIARGVGGAQICGLGFAQWNIPEIPPPPEGAVETIYVRSPEAFNIDALAAALRNKASFNIVLAYHIQDFTQFLDVTIYRAVFPVVHRDVPVFDERYLLINIRTGDILDGHVHPFDWYPLTPIGFFEELVAKSGKLPVFMGELDDCLYVRQLKARFPDAVYLPSQGAMRDFDTIRAAKHIVVAISTFSWLAAWLSEAVAIHLPLSGFYNPAHKRDINLLPVNDQRYQFYLFPLNYAMSEIESLRLHERMRGTWRKISRAKVAVLRQNAARIAPGWIAGVDRFWYMAEYLDAAMDVSEGWYADAQAHYLDFGRSAGYLPEAPLVMAPVPIFANIALGKPAVQSSVSQWSRAGSIEADAAGAVDGDVAKPYGFHTDAEANPWWMVDLTAAHNIYAIHVYNRAGDYLTRARTAPLVVMASVDGLAWQELTRTAPGELFGAERGPLCWAADDPIIARYVKVMIEAQRQFLHLAQVAVFGEVA